MTAPGASSAAELARMQAELTSSLVVMTELMDPLFDAANGVKSSLEQRGWSAASAEQAALGWLSQAMTMAMGGGAS